MSKHQHSKNELKEMAKAHNMSVEELEKHIAAHENMEYAKTHEILLDKEFTDEELAVMAKDHNMSLQDMKQHIEMAKRHHPKRD